MGIAKKKEDVSPAEFIAAEQELHDLKEQYGISDNKKKSVITRFFERASEREEVECNRKTYLLLNLLLGWAGAHRFYSKRYVLGVLYLAFCWTGLSIAMSIIDLLVAIPKPVDNDGMIRI